MFAEFDQCRVPRWIGRTCEQWARALKVDDLLERLFSEEELQ